MCKRRTDDREKYKKNDVLFVRFIGIVLLLVFIFGVVLAIYRLATPECREPSDCNGFNCVNYECQCDEITEMYVKCNPNGYYDPVIDGLAWTFTIVLFTAIFSLFLCFNI